MMKEGIQDSHVFVGRRALEDCASFRSGGGRAQRKEGVDFGADLRPGWVVFGGGIFVLEADKNRGCFHR